MHKAGFTLVEILVVMVISTIVILGIHTAYGQAHRVWKKVETGRLTDQAACSLLETLRMELAALYWPPVPVDINDANQPFELVTTPEGQRQLSFFTLVPCWKTGPLSGRPAKVVYRFGRDKAGHLGTLERVESPFAGNRVIGAQRMDVILDGLTEGNIWAVDPNGPEGELLWREELPWSGILPRAVKVHLRWPSQEGRVETGYETCLLIPCKSPAGR